ncbi:MAG: MFS transporter [Flavobacteriales bacterium]|nr:MFS transporter [Flavobacteriales bacterium]MCB9193788.1 MFS transporter [Flavobacteriales bacterium]
MKRFPRTVWLLACVSLFTDMASELLYPVMPLYLHQIGFSVLLIGILEGLAEALAGLSKGWFGHWSDRSGRRIPFVRAGYALSAVAKPLFAVSIWPPWVFLARTLDRLGKGARTGARDALLNAAATDVDRGRVFGLHRGMDTLGAVIGPLLALIYIQFRPDDLRTLFLLAFLPGVVSVLLTLMLKRSMEVQGASLHRPTGSLFAFWRQAPRAYRTLVLILCGFALANSSDLFLLLKAKEAGLGDTSIILAYVAYNLVHALAALPAGAIGDRIGLRSAFLIGLAFFSGTYLALSGDFRMAMFIAVLAGYGLFAAFTEGVGKAWVCSLVPKEHAGTAAGLFATGTSLAGLVASPLTGYVWYAYGSRPAFLLSAAVAVVVAVVLLVWGPKAERRSPEAKLQGPASGMGERSV